MIYTERSTKFRVNVRWRFFLFGVGVENWYQVKLTSPAITFINSLFHVTCMQVAYSPVNDEIKRAFEAIVGENNVSSAMVVREQHGKDESHHKCHPADLVVWPTNREQVCQVAKLCNDNCLPLIPFGSGTGLEGGVVAKKVLVHVVNGIVNLCN